RARAAGVRERRSRRGLRELFRQRERAVGGRRGFRASFTRGTTGSRRPPTQPTCARGLRRRQAGAPTRTRWRVPSSLVARENADRLRSTTAHDGTVFRWSVLILGAISRYAPSL